MVLEILAVILIILLVAAISYWRLYNDGLKTQQNLAENDISQQEKIKHDADTIQTLSDELAAKDDKYNEAMIFNAKLSEQNKSHQEKIEFLTQLKSEMSKDFRLVANEIIDNNQNKINKQAQQTIDPLQNEIKQFKERIETITTEQTKERSSLLTQIQNLQQTHIHTQQSTQKLTNALTYDNKTQGNWGEVVLDSILDASGLREGHEYQRQPSFKDDNAQTFRPDVILHLPDNKDIVIDSKVSLKAYTDYINAPEDKTLLKAHAKSIQNHIDGISTKSYDQLIGLRSLDFILVFIPIESALLLALEEKQTLFTNALNKGIMLTSPSTLTMSLKIVHHLWKTEEQNKNTDEIVRQASNMYDKFVLFSESLNEVGNQLDNAQKSHQKATARLTSDKGNLFSRAQRLKALGLQTKKELA